MIAGGALGEARALGVDYCAVGCRTVGNGRKGGEAEEVVEGGGRGGKLALGSTVSLKGMVVFGRGSGGSGGTWLGGLRTDGVQIDEEVHGLEIWRSVDLGRSWSSPCSNGSTSNAVT